jgi:hypothetical protein
MQKSLEKRMFKGIMRWQQSGLTQKAWCEKNKMSYGTFHYWYKRYRFKENGDESREETGGFVSIRVDEPLVTSGWCELWLSENKKVVFYQPVNAEFLKSLIG